MDSLESREHEESEAEPTGISAEKQRFGKGEDENQLPSQSKEVLALSQAWHLELEETEEERPSHLPVFLEYRKYARAAIRATPATTPTTIPAMAPAGRPELPGPGAAVMERKKKE